MAVAGGGGTAATRVLGEQSGDSLQNLEGNICSTYQTHVTSIVIEYTQFSTHQISDDMVVFFSTGRRQT